MYYFSKIARGRILHTENCHHIRRTTVARLGAYGELCDGFYDGFRLCKHCSPLEKCLGRERGMIIDFSLKNGIAVSSDRKGFNIQTLSSLWKITARDSGKGIALYHANQFAYGKSKINGYHLQGDVKCTSCAKAPQALGF